MCNNNCLMPMIKISSGLFTNFSVKEEKPKSRCKSIAVIKKSTKSKSINAYSNFVNKNSTIRKIYSNNLSPNAISNNIYETISPKHQSLNKSTVNIPIEKSIKILKQKFASAKSEVLKKSNNNKHLTLLDSNRRKKKLLHFSFNSTGEPACNIIINHPTLSTCKDSLNSDTCLNNAPGSLSLNHLEILSRNQSFQSQESLPQHLKVKALKIFTEFKCNHLKILQEFKSRIIRH